MLAHLWLGRAYQAQQKHEDAVAEFRRAEAVLHGWPVVKAAIGHVQGTAGRRREALETLRELERLSGERYVTPYGIALVHAALGETDQTLLCLERALEDRAHWLVWLELDPRFDGLRSDRRFEDGEARRPPVSALQTGVGQRLARATSEETSFP